MVFKVIWARLINPVLAGRQSIIWASQALFPSRTTQHHYSGGEAQEQPASLAQAARNERRLARQLQEAGAETALLKRRLEAEAEAAAAERAADAAELRDLRDLLRASEGRRLRAMQVHLPLFWS